MKSEMSKMFRYPSMIKAASFCAAVFALLAVLLKQSIVIIPEVSEVRVCNIVAISFGIWFGPAGALGCAVGNLIGDMDGSLTILTLYGFIGNFLSAWIPYKVWNVLGDLFKEHRMERPSFAGPKAVLRYLTAAILSVVSCCGWLAFVFDFYDTMPTANTFCILSINNMTSSLLGMVLFWIMSLIPQDILPYWREMMTDEKDMYFPQKHVGKVNAIVALSIALVAFYVIYMISNKLALFTMDSFSRPLPIIVGMVYVAAVVLLTILCRWEKSKVELTL